MSAENRVELSELRRAVNAHDGEIVTGLDRFGRIVDQHWVDGMSTATDRFQYGYDENSNRLFRRNVVDATFSELYAYDNFDQLSDFSRGTLSTTSDSIVGTPVRSQDWSPHPLGNAATISTSISGTPTPEGRLYNAQNQFTSVGGNSINYDANGNLITDQHGNIYKYDAWNRLVKVEDSSNDLLTAYSYNPLNRRIIEDDGTTETHLFYSANWQVLEEQVASDTTVQYVWSPVYIDALILRDRDTDANGSLDERLYVQQDANWNVTALVDASTGDVVQRFVQEPFGLVTDILDDSWSPQADAYDWKYLHQGLRLDMAVGMNLYDGRNRIYDPVLQRWLQVDPSGFEAGDSNLYRYVNNNPIIFQDPLGEAIVNTGGIRFNFLKWCTPPIVAGFGICVTGTVEVLGTKCCQGQAGPERTCYQGAVQIDVGATFIASMGGNPGKGDFGIFSIWRTLKRLKNSVNSVIQAVKQVFNGDMRGAIISLIKAGPPLMIQHTTQCPPEGLDYRFCITVSAGFSTLSVGCRVCYYFRGDEWVWNCGFGVGTGTGVVGGGGITFTICT